ncbi:hypothetical protein DP64_02405 [Stutzerimonas degradans]|nr:hypothetical protein DP64_02405 [Stutzerimonas degradans]
MFAAWKQQNISQVKRAKIYSAPMQSIYEVGQRGYELLCLLWSLSVEFFDGFAWKRAIYTGA